MTLDCADLHACADLLHEEAARVMANTDLTRLEAVPRLRRVVAIEEVAAEVESKIADTC